MSKMKRNLSVILTLAIVASVASAGTSVQWAGALESLGSDASWDSATAVRGGYNNYFYDCRFTTVEVQIDADGGMWMDYSPAYSPDSAGLSQGVVANVLNSVYDTNELSFELDVSIDNDGYAHATLSSVVFGDPWADANIIGIRFNFTLSDKAVQQVWGDDFDSYQTTQWLGDTNDWSTTGWERFFNPPYETSSRRAEVGTYAGQLWFRDDWYGGYPDSWYEEIKDAVADGTDSHHLNGVELTDYIVTVQGYKRGTDTSTKSNYYTFARHSSHTDNILFEIGWGPYSEKYYAILYDTAGDGVLDPVDANNFEFRYVGQIDMEKPVNMLLKVEGTEVMGVAEHNGGKAVMRYNTTLTSGEPGLGAEWKWGYMDSLFDNFAVYAVTAEDPQACGDDGTLYLETDLNQDCQVDYKDLAEVADNWLESL